MIIFMPSFVPSFPIGMNPKPESVTISGILASGWCVDTLWWSFVWWRSWCVTESSNKPPEEKHQERQYHIVHKQANLARGLFNSALILTFHICAGPWLLSGCQHSRVVTCDDVIQLIDQFLPLKGDMSSSLLKVFDCKHLILVTIAVPVFMDMIGETTGDVGTVVGNRFSVQKHQHPLKVS